MSYLLDRQIAVLLILSWVTIRLAFKFPYKNLWTDSFSIPRLMSNQRIRASDESARNNQERWKNSPDNIVLMPTTSQPKGVVHFLGGAFFGSAPQIFYNSFLESLSQQGYIVVATPYRIQMDYTAICDDVIRRFDTIASELAKEYGPLVVVGVGHSLGAVLQTLITSLFPETPRAINILISFNGRSAIDSVPWYEEVVIPLSKQYDRYRNETLGSSQRPSPRAIDRIFSNPLDPSFTLFTLLSMVREQLDSVVVNSNTAEADSRKQLLSSYQQLTGFVDQLPLLLSQIASGQEEFSPQFVDIKEICRRMYRARRTLVIQFNQDNLDDSEEIASILKEANTIMRMKRPMIEMEVQLERLEGTHLTPLSPLRDDRVSSSRTPRLPKITSSFTSIVSPLSDCNLPLPECRAAEIVSNGLREPANLDSLIEKISNFLLSNVK